MEKDPDQPGRVASDYLGKYGRDAVIYIDGDIAKALGTQRWDDYKLLHRARIRMRRMQLSQQLEQRAGGGFGQSATKLARHF